MERMQIRGSGIFFAFKCINSVDVGGGVRGTKDKGQPRECANAEPRLARARGAAISSVTFTGAKAEACSRRREGAGEGW